jgi:hypothetical protein
MSLADYQRALRALAFDRNEPVGDMAAFALYRTMIRGRLVDMARRAYPLTWRRVGAAACDASFARYLGCTPPASPFLREVIASFAEFGCADSTLAARAPFAADLVRFEAAKWRTSDAPFSQAVSLREVDFDGALALNPTLAILSLSHPVDRAADERTDMVRCAEYVLLVYRRQDDDVHWYRATPLFGALLARAQGGAHALGVLLATELAARRLAATETLLSALAGELAVAVERCVVLGCLPE